MASDAAEGTGNGPEDKLVLPSVTESADPADDGREAGSNGYAESIILDGEYDGQESAAEFFLPRIEVNPVRNLTDNGLPTWNNEFESLVLCRKPRREIIAENAHPNCFGSVGASGLSRVFTSGSFCPDMSSLSMAPKNHLKYDSCAALDAHNPLQTTDMFRPIEKSKTIAHIPRSRNKTLKMPEITASKVSLFSRDGEPARNMVFVPNARMTREDRAKSDLEAGSRQLAKLGASNNDGAVRRLVERRGLINSRTPREAAVRSKDVRRDSIKPAESESDELTPSEVGIMGTKINDWFTAGKGSEDRGTKHKVHQGARNKRQSKNLWDPGMQRRIHRGLASSVFKPNTCIGNYLNDVTASRFPQVEIRQIVFTR